MRSSRLAGGGGILASSLTVCLDPSEALGLFLRLLNHPLALCYMSLSGGLCLGSRCSETLLQLLDSFAGGGGILASSLTVCLNPSEALGLFLRLLNHPLALCYMSLSG
ncbi:hypothetical protein ACV1CZ_21450, partial [Aeromonas caviae]